MSLPFPSGFRPEVVKSFARSNIDDMVRFGVSPDEALSIAGTMLRTIMKRLSREYADGDPRFASLRTLIAMMSVDLRRLSELETPGAWIKHLTGDAVTDARSEGSH